MSETSKQRLNFIGMAFALIAFLANIAGNVASDWLKQFNIREDNNLVFTGCDLEKTEILDGIFRDADSCMLRVKDTPYAPSIYFKLRIKESGEYKIGMIYRSPVEFYTYINNHTQKKILKASLLLRIQTRILHRLI